MKWGRILVAGIGTFLAVLLVITLVVTGYAFKLAFEVRGAPNQALIAQFAEHLGRSSWWALQILLTVPGAAWTARKAQHSKDFLKLIGNTVGPLPWECSKIDQSGSMVLQGKDPLH